MPILGVIASSNQQARAFLPTGSYDALAVYTVPSGGASSITFAGIPQSGYQHLQIRCLINTTSGIGGSTCFTINGDTASNYTNHELTGYYNNGSAGYGGFSYTTSSGRNYCQSLIINGFSAPLAIIWDILDYTNSTKYKTIKCLYGTDNNGSNSNEIGLSSSLWLNTNTINSLTFTNTNGYSFPQYSQIALYGIRG